MERILKYFPELTGEQQDQFRKLEGLYSDWNEKINLISRRDIPYLYERHILHSLSVARIISFRPGTKILDVGTGGGFPGIPLAILFPDSAFTLVDSIGKKITAVGDIIDSLGLRNAKAVNQRAEDLKGSWHFITSRAVTAFPRFYAWVRDKVSTDQFNDRPNGIFYLKGGDLEPEIASFGSRAIVFQISDFFGEEFFETKKIIYLPVKGKA